MIENRLTVLREVMSATGLLFLTIDFVEVSKLATFATMFLAVTTSLRTLPGRNATPGATIQNGSTVSRTPFSLIGQARAVDYIRESRSEKSKSNYQSRQIREVAGLAPPTLITVRDPNARTLSMPYVIRSTNADVDTRHMPGSMTGNASPADLATIGCIGDRWQL